MDFNVPEDAVNPDFESVGKVHDWKKYASDRLIGYWDLFSSAQKQVIAECLQDIANNEEWD